MTRIYITRHYGPIGALYRAEYISKRTEKPVYVKSRPSFAAWYNVNVAKGWTGSDRSYIDV